MTRAVMRLPGATAGQILIPTRGRLLRPPMLPAQRSPAAAWKVAALLLALPMFAQCFQYMIDVPPLYALSKAWPLLMLPVGAWAVLALDLPYKPLYIATLVWLLGVTPVIGIVQLGNGAVDAMATTAKVWSYSFVFSAAGVLVLVNPAPALLRRVIAWLGVATFVVMLLLWVGVPVSSYGGGDVVTKLFMFDPERGYHIYMPMYFGVLLVLTLNRSFWARPAVWKFAAIAVAFAIMLMIYKERVANVAAAAAMVFGAAMSVRRFRPAAFAVLGVAAVIFALFLLNRLEDASDLHDSLGGSLAVRRVSVATAWSYLTADPLRWLFGVGATTRFGDITLAGLFGNAMFFLTDIGWLGVIFEYGVIGALLMLLVHLAGWRQAIRWGRPDDPLSQAFGDYIVYLLVGSAVYSVVFTPGELTTTMALSYYFSRGAAAAET